MRKTKGKDEFVRHSEAAKRLDGAYGVAQAMATVGKTELDLFRAANSEAFRASGPAEQWMHSNVLGDFVSGSRTLQIGGPPTARALSAGETVILDLQTCYEGYWADTARTFLVDGRPSKRQVEVYETLLAARTAAQDLLRPGTRARDIYRVVSETIEKAGFDRLPHHAGHGVGLDGQEPPYFLPNSDEELEEGVLCAVEPGIYDAEAGGMRIEDNYIITRSGFEKSSAYGLSLK
jgi:Xaa-Pro dipeptidase